jgi:hypothetical protein
MGPRFSAAITAHVSGVVAPFSAFRLALGHSSCRIPPSAKWEQPSSADNTLSDAFEERGLSGDSPKTWLSGQQGLALSMSHRKESLITLRVTTKNENNLSLAGSDTLAQTIRASALVFSGLLCAGFPLPELVSFTDPSGAGNCHEA